MISFLSHCNQNLMILFLHFLIRKQCLEIIKKVQKFKSWNFPKKKKEKKKKRKKKCQKCNFLPWKKNFFCRQNSFLVCGKMQHLHYFGAKIQMDYFSLNPKIILSSILTSMFLFEVKQDFEPLIRKWNLNREWGGGGAIGVKWRNELSVRSWGALAPGEIFRTQQVLHVDKHSG